MVMGRGRAVMAGDDECLLSTRDEGDGHRRKAVRRERVSSLTLDM